MCCSRFALAVRLFLRQRNADTAVDAITPEGAEADKMHTCCAQNTRTSGNAVHGRIQDEVDKPAGGDGAAPAGASDASQEGNINVARLMGSVEYGRPLAQGARQPLTRLLIAKAF